jgi:pyruvate,water dikinase
MAGLFPNALNNQDFLNRMIQTEGRAVSLRVQELPKSFILYYYARLIFRVLFFQREIDHFYALAERHFSALGRLPKPRTAEEAYGPVVYLEKHLLPIWSTTVDNDFLVMTYHGIFENVLQKWFKKSGLEMKNSLLAGMGYVVSAEQATTLAELAEVCFEFKDLALLMKNGEFSKAADLVNSFPDLRERIENYKQKYGNRFALDLKLEAKNPLDDPGELFKIFGAYKQVSLKNIKAGQAEAAQRALVVEAKARGQLSPLRRWAFGLLLRKLRHHIRHREQMRLFRSKVFQEARLAFSALGKILAKQGLLDQPDDVFYLETEELGRYFNATLTVDALKPIVKFRKAEYASFAKSTPPVNFATSKLPKQSIPQAGGSPKGRGKAFIGLASSAGIVAGTATVLTDPIVPEKPIEILVVRHTDPGWTPIIALAKGVVVERGGLLSHAAIITRELGIPSVIGVEGAMQAIRTGDRILVDGFKGEVSIQS